MKTIPFETLLGKIITSVEETYDTIVFTTNSGQKYSLHHSQDCCEHVSVEDVNGDWEDIIGNPITLAEESTSYDFNEEQAKSSESCTWTFYKLATVKGYVDIRWFGESNGYYSEEVELYELLPPPVRRTLQESLEMEERIKAKRNGESFLDKFVELKLKELSDAGDKLMDGFWLLPTEGYILLSGSTDSNFLNNK